MPMRFSAPPNVVVSPNALLKADHRAIETLPFVQASSLALRYGEVVTPVEKPPRVVRSASPPWFDSWDWPEELVVGAWYTMTGDCE